MYKTRLTGNSACIEGGHFEWVGGSGGFTLGQPPWEPPPTLLSVDTCLQSWRDIVPHLRAPALIAIGRATAPIVALSLGPGKCTSHLFSLANLLEYSKSCDKSVNSRTLLESIIYLIESVHKSLKTII